MSDSKNYIMKLHCLIIFVTTVLLASCASKLDNYPLDKFPEELVWSSAESAQLFVYEAQQSIIPWWQYYNRMDNLSNNNVFNGSTAVNAIVQETVTSDNMASSVVSWDQFSNIRKCNMIILKVTESEGINEADKPALIAQGKFLRGMVYYMQARTFGKYVIIEEVLTPEDELKLPRSATIKDTYDFIIKDLQEAAPNLPVSVPSGAISRGAAYALLAEAALQGAAYLDNPSDKNTYYQIAKTAGEELFALGQYSLDSDYAGMFNNNDTGLGSKEIILGLYYLPGNTRMSTAGVWMMNMVPNTGSGKTPDDVMAVWPVENFEGWLDKSPSVELVNDYLVIDADGEAKKWDETSYYLNFLANGGYVSQAIYKNRDKRFYASIAYDSTMYFNSLLTMRLGGNMYYLNNLEKNTHMTKTGYVWRKSVYQDLPVISSTYTSYHTVPLRLGRSYLNHAEALLRLGDIPEAIGYINETRTVHGGLPALTLTLTQDEAWYYYKLERRVDLALEDDRYWSLLRWGKEEGLETIPELNGIPQAIEIAEDGLSFRHIDVPIVTSANTRRFTSKRYLLPVPRTERNENPNLDQNPGWD